MIQRIKLIEIRVTSQTTTQTIQPYSTHRSLQVFLQRTTRGDILPGKYGVPYCVPL